MWTLRRQKCNKVTTVQERVGDGNKGLNYMIEVAERK